MAIFTKSSGFTKSGDIELSNGFIIPKNYGGMTHGYVVTSHASQGATVDKVLIALSTESLAAANRQQLYVSVSRGREAVRLYTDDKRAVMEAVRADAKRLSATEMLEGVAPVHRSSRMQRLMHVQKIQRAYEGVKERMLAWSRPARERGGAACRLRKHAPPWSPKILGSPADETEPREAMRDARPAIPTPMLDVAFRSGKIVSFSYAYLTSVVFEPEGRLELHFGDEVVVIEGRNLHDMRQKVRLHRADEIQEGRRGGRGAQARKPSACGADSDCE